VLYPSRDAPLGSQTERRRVLLLGNTGDGAGVAATA
jgi:hypothetical protein